MNSNPQRSHHSAGFSLIELLVVLVIITLLAGTLSIAIDFASQGGDRLQQSAQRLGTSFVLAQEEALLADDYLGLSLISGHGGERGEGHPLELRWLRYGSGQWHPVGAPLSSVPLHEGQSLTLAVDGEELPLQVMAGPVQPFLLLDPTGVTEDFELRLQAVGGDEQFVLFVNEYGVLEETWRQH